MAVKKVNGHGVTSVLGPHGGQAALPGEPTFSHTQGPAAYTAPGSSPVPGGLPGGSNGGKKKSSPQAPNKSVSPILKG